MNIRTLIAATTLGAAFAAATPVFAQNAPDVYDKCYNNVNGAAGTIYAHACAGATVNASQSAASGNIGNGYSAPSNYAQGNGTVSTTASNGGWTDRAAASAGNSSISTSSSLTDGKLHSYAATGSDGRAYSLARIGDTVTFNNTTGHSLTLGIGYTYDGRFTGAGGSNGDTAAIYLNIADPSRNITFAGSGQEVGGYGQTLAYADGFFDQRWLNAGTAADFSLSKFGTPGSGLFGGAVSTTISIPAGTSQLGFALTLDIACGVLNSVCDFGQTSAFNFGALPTGLTYTSQSGVLFSALTPVGPIVGGVPEPASWALMILGFGLVGAAMRSRRPRVGVLQAA